MRARAPRARLLRELARRHEVDGGDGEHVDRGEERAAAVVLGVRERLAEERQVEHVAGDARPHGLLRVLVGEDGDAVADLAQPHRAHRRDGRGVGVLHADDAVHDLRREELGQPEAEAEVAEEVGGALAAGAAVVVGEALVGLGGRGGGAGARPERRADVVAVRRARVEGCAHRRSPWGCVWCAAAAAGRADPA
jgi:hypothetical protein